MLFWRLAYRNLLRHRGRLILNLILLVGGFTTIICFKGFRTHVLNVIQESIIDNQLGHIQVARPSFWNNSPVEQITDKMIGNTDELIEKISKLDSIEFVSPRISFYGLINTEEQSYTAHFIGFQPAIETKAQKGILFLEGEEFKQSKQLIVSTGLKKKLKVKSHDDVTVVGQTVLGGINAMDLSISGIFSSGFAEIDNGTVFISYQDALKIMDSTYSDRILIRVKEGGSIQKTAEEVKNLLKGMDLQVKDWKELAELYNQVENFYDFQNFFIEVIILLLLFLSVANTVTMTVFERLGEIGTLRALGDYESDIQKLFVTESFILGMLSIVIGIPFSFLIIKIISTMDIKVVMPMATQPIPFLLVPTLQSFIEAAVVCLMSIVGASIWPSRKGSKASIVTALGAKI